MKHHSWNKTQESLSSLTIADGEDLEEKSVQSDKKDLDTLDSELTNLENEKPTVGQPTDDQEMESEPNELDDVADQ